MSNEGHFINLGYNIGILIRRHLLVPEGMMFVIKYIHDDGGRPNINCLSIGILA